MKILEVKTLAIEPVKVIRFGRFRDHRGYFTEHYRKSDFQHHPELTFFKGVDFLQANESFSRTGTVRGLHFQWNPYVGKLVRTLTGRMVDMVLDIRTGSPTFGKIILYDMPVDRSGDFHEWIWVPPGFAHGNFFTEDTLIEYYCTGQYNPDCEAGICPLSKDIDWQLCEPKLRELFDSIVPETELISDKDRDGFSVSGWQSNPDSKNFVYGQL
jgi:dTDP-4-dehydrorhamnose 3,5-epimerase